MAQRISDTTHIECAMREGRAILTEDLDFTELLSTGAWGAATPTIIQLRLEPLRRAARSARVLASIAEIEPIEQGMIYCVEPARIRKWPVGA